MGCRTCVFSSRLEIQYWIRLGWIGAVTCVLHLLFVPSFKGPYSQLDKKKKKMALYVVPVIFVPLLILRVFLPIMGRGMVADELVGSGVSVVAIFI